MALATYKRGDIQTIKYLAGAAIAVNQIVVAGGTADGKKVCVGVAREAIANTETGIVAVTGVFRFPKVSAAVIKAGEAVSWDASLGEVDDNALTTAIGDVAQFGCAMEDAGTGVLFVDVAITEAGTYDGT
jgi:predicted RecA/RadA family phage recombinase